MKYPLLFALLAAPAALFAADASQTIIDRAQQAAPRPAAPTAPAGIEVSPGDLDAGNQRVAQRREVPFKLSFSSDTQVYYTDNLQLASPGTAKEDAFVFAQTLALNGQFRSLALGESMLTPSIGLAYQRFHHGLGEGKDFSSSDFDSYSVPAGLRYRFGANWEAAFTVTGSSVYGNDPATNYHEILRSCTIGLNLRKLFSLSDKQIISCGTGFGYTVSKADVSEIDPSIAYRDDRNDKCDYSADLGYYYMLGSWVIGPTARLSYSDYLHYQEAAFNDVNRRDLAASFGLSVSYNLKPWASARVFSSYDVRKPQGDDSGYEYTSKTLGLGLSLSAEF